MDKRKIQKLLVGELSFKRLIRSVIFIYAALLVFAFLASDKMMFPIPPASYDDGPDIIKIKTEDGATISAIHLINPDAEYTVLYSHANYVDLGRLEPFLQEYKNRGFSVFAYDYHGYGTSEGRPTEKNVCLDAEAAFKYLTEEAKVAPGKIILYGRSVGTGPGIYLASRYNIAGLIAESPFVTAFRVVTRIPIFPFDKFRNITLIDKINCPVLFIHGKADRTIPIWHSQKLFEKAKEPKLFCRLENASHNVIPADANKIYWQAINEFIEVVKVNSR